MCLCVCVCVCLIFVNLFMLAKEAIESGDMREMVRLKEEEGKGRVPDEMDEQGKGTETEKQK